MARVINNGAARRGRRNSTIYTAQMGPEVTMQLATGDMKALVTQSVDGLEVALYSSSAVVIMRAFCELHG